MSTANTSLSQQLDEKPWVDALDNSSVQEYQGFDAAQVTTSRFSQKIDPWFYKW